MKSSPPNRLKVNIAGPRLLAFVAAGMSVLFAGVVVGRTFSTDDSVSLDAAVSDDRLQSPVTGALATMLFDERASPATEIHILAVFSVACGHCYGEAIRWGEMAAKFDERVRISGLAVSSMSDTRTRQGEA